MPLRTNFSRFKEPRGFIKIIQFVIAIFAFSTTAGYYSEFTANLSYPCPPTSTNEKNRHDTVKFSYSFNEVDIYVGATECTSSSSPAVHQTINLPSSLKSSSEFFVFVGVISFLYCIISMVYYICFEDPAKYEPGGTGRDLKSFATVDFVVTIILTLFWFCGSAAWAAGITKLKDKTDAEDYCKPSIAAGNKCNITDKANYAGLIISVLFGFLSCFLWGANVWFVFKETIWHKEPGATTTAEQPQVEIPRQEVPGEAVP